MHRVEDIVPVELIVDRDMRQGLRRNQGSPAVERVFKRGDHVRPVALTTCRERCHSYNFV